MTDYYPYYAEGRGVVRKSNKFFIFKVVERQITDKVMLCYKKSVPQIGLQLSLNLIV